MTLQIYKGSFRNHLPRLVPSAKHNLLMEGKSFPDLNFSWSLVWRREGEHYSSFLCPVATYFPLPDSSKHLTVTCIDDSTIFFSLSISSFGSLLQTNLSDHDFLVWKVRNTHHGTRKHICSDFRVVNFSLPSMRITSVLRLWKIKCIFHRELKCRNSHNFLLK